MKLARYLYAGPPSAASLRLGNTVETLEVLLRPGKPVELPPEHEYTRVLLALKHLRPLPIVIPSTGKVPVLLTSAKE
ncbi:hypothetical protein [Pseudomonas prosekii]|uniref:hypothetical protein n=1 Tax=Pseudomonas prosekii TaxID=1148509 RepID=UPI00387B861E